MDDTPTLNLEATGSFAATAGSDRASVSLAASGTKTPEPDDSGSRSEVRLPEFDGGAS